MWVIRRKHIEYIKKTFGDSILNQLKEYLEAYFDEKDNEPSDLIHVRLDGFKSESNIVESIQFVFEIGKDIDYIDDSFFNKWYEIDKVDPDLLCGYTVLLRYKDYQGSFSIKRLDKYNPSEEKWHVPEGWVCKSLYSHVMVLED